MTVAELIEELEKMNKDSIVWLEIRDDYRPSDWTEVDSVYEERDDSTCIIGIK